MSKFDDQYLDLCERVLSQGERVVNYSAAGDSRSSSAATTIPDHASMGKSGATTIRLPHQVLTFDLSEEFPILTTKFVGWKTAVLEMLWIYQAASNKVDWLHERGVKIWNEWEIPESGEYQGRDFVDLYKKAGLDEDPRGTIGTAYGWIVNRYDLVRSLIETLKTNPNNRRMIMSLWQNEWLPTAALPSCVWNSQWNVTYGSNETHESSPKDRKPRLNLMVTVRSNDIPLGMPFNVCQYAVLCHLIAQSVGMEAGQMTYVINDAHIYENQVDGIKEQIQRRKDKLAADGKLFDAPKLWINPEVKDFFKFDNSKELKDIRLENYEHQGRIIMPVTE